LGTVHGYRGHFVHDHFADRGDADSWRLDPAKAGSGVIGDIGSSALDLARHLIGDISEISAQSRTVLSSLVDDEAGLQLRFASGATGHIWLSWLATGTPMNVGFHVLGDLGTLKFSWLRPSELFRAGGATIG
jgi:predicted dehydrogenase